MEEHKVREYFYHFKQNNSVLMHTGIALDKDSYKKKSDIKRLTAKEMI